MPSEALTRLLSRQNGQATSNGLVDHTPIPDQSEEVVQLRSALMSNRRISLAMGILLRDQDIDESQAFAYLRHVSQDSNRKLRDVAEEVIHHRGLLPDTRRAERLHS
jgi:hypothetical protein